MASNKDHSSKSGIENGLKVRRVNRLGLLQVFEFAHFERGLDETDGKISMIITR